MSAFNQVTTFYLISDRWAEAEERCPQMEGESQEMGCEAQGLQHMMIHYDYD